MASFITKDCYKVVIVSFNYQTTALYGQFKVYICVIYLNNQWKQEESHQNGVATHFGATTFFFAMKAVSQTSSQR